MSTSFEFARRVPVSALAAVVLTVVVCAVAWPMSTSAGGGHDTEAEAFVREISMDVRLTPMCQSIGVGLAQSGVRRKVSERRPTTGMWAASERKAVDAWEAARCPTAALASIAYGVSEVANTDQRTRAAEADR